MFLLSANQLSRPCIKTDNAIFSSFFFRNVVRFSLVAGAVLLVLVYMSGKKSDVTINKTSTSSKSSAGLFLFSTSWKSCAYCAFVLSNLKFHTLVLMLAAGKPAERPPTGATGPRTQDGAPQHRMDKNNGRAATGVARAAQQTKHPDHNPEIPDVVQFNLDDSTEPRFPTKPDRNEAEDLAKKFLLPGKSKPNPSLAVREIIMKDGTHVARAKRPLQCHANNFLQFAVSHELF